MLVVTCTFKYLIAVKFSQDFVYTFTKKTSKYLEWSKIMKKKNEIDDFFLYLDNSRHFASIVRPYKWLEKMVIIIIEFVPHTRKKIIYFVVVHICLDFDILWCFFCVWCRSFLSSQYTLLLKPRPKWSIIIIIEGWHMTLRGLYFSQS